MTETRIESDSMGQLHVPADALWGAQTQRAVDNFPISGKPMPETFIQSLGRVKLACARANLALGLIEADAAEAIVAAASRVIDGEVTAHFLIDIYQTGSGTSSNMNANEVIARLAAQAGHAGIHPNDHVNMSQSSNDVIPTTIQVSACLQVHERLIPAAEHLLATLENKAVALDGVVKTGRTHLMDAMPVTFGQELRAWAAQVRSCIGRLRDALERLRFLPQGGTAVGTGINAPAEFGDKVAAELETLTGFPFRSAENKFEGIATQDGAVELSGQLKTFAVALMKIANDLRWMNSGPLAGANDATITVGGQAGNFQLNVMRPVIGATLLESIELLANVSRLMADKAIATFKVREDNIKSALDRNPILVTALNRVIGYEKGAATAKQAYKEGRPIIDVAMETTGMSREELEKLLDPLQLAHGGVQD